MRWVAQEGETPGWDIEFSNTDGNRTCVEVKATTASRFTSIDITANEWRAAMEHAERYWLAMVTGVESAHPRIVLLKNPFEATQTGTMDIEPIAYRLYRETENND